MKPQDMDSNLPANPNTPDIQVDPHGYWFGREVDELVNLVPDRCFQRAADLGSGDGALSICLHRSGKAREIWGFEIDDSRFSRSEDNIRASCRDGSVHLLKTDIRKLKSVFQRGSFDLVVANPPFFKHGSGFRINSDSERAARQEIHGSLRHFIQIAKFLLGNQGEFVMVFHPSRLDYAIHELEAGNFTVKTMKLLYHPDGRALFVLFRTVPLGRKGMTILPPVILDPPPDHGTGETDENNTCGL